MKSKFNYTNSNDNIMETARPDYNRIYSDIITIKYPEKIEICKALLEKRDLSVLDIIELNQKIFGPDKDISTELFNQKHRSYKPTDILQILDFQKKHILNNTQLAKHFKLSRNTVTKWKRNLI